MPTPAAQAATDTRWTCPFCPLLCDDLQARPPEAGGDPAWQLAGGDCPRALAALSAFQPEDAAASPRIDGRPATLDEALAAAAAVLGTARQPLFGGLATDVAGARALYRLACATGAISDAASGPALMAALRALQDRGGYTTTLAELRSRADLVISIGGDPTEAAPRLWHRPDGLPPRARWQLGGPAPADAQVQHLPLAGDLFDALALLAAQLDGRAVPQPDARLQALADALTAAHYAVLVAEPGRFGAQAGLVVETVNRVVALLNRKGRAAALWLGGGDGAASVNQTFSWLSGLPLRSRAGPAGLEHQPLAWDATTLLSDSSVDALLWVASFGPGLLPPGHEQPMVVLGHPALALPTRSARTVFIPVATPGVGQAGHLVRTDGTVLLPLFAARPDGLPSVADVVQQLTQRLVQTQAPATAEVAHG